MATINFDELPQAVERKTDPKTNRGSKFSLDQISPRIVDDVENLLGENASRLEEGKRPKVVVQECGSVEGAQEWLRQMDKYRLYRPDGQITIRVPNRPSIKRGETTQVQYAAKPMEQREAATVKTGKKSK